MNYGYARCSTNEQQQDINRQKRELRKMGADGEIFWEYESGAKENRPELDRLLKTAKEGDSIFTTEVSRLTRSTSHLCKILDTVKEKKLQLQIGSFIVDCRAEEIDPMTKGMLMMWGVFAEMERDIIRQRVKSGMENARAKGKQIGRPFLTKEKIPDSFYKCYDLYKRDEITISDMARMMSCGRSTVYRYIRIYEGSGKGA